jgi:anaerobic magnesium-protoporphyrin IX monomethyl ester cyclase
VRILFIWPRAFELTQTFPLAYAQLAACVDRSRHELRLLDCNLEGLQADSPRFERALQDFAPDVVGFSCWAFGVSEVTRGVRVVKRALPGATTVVGGVHMTLCPEVFEAVSEIDFAFRGDATRAFPRFVEELEAGRARWDDLPGLGWRDAAGEITLNPIEHARELDDLPYPDYAFAGLRRYHEIGYGFLTMAARSAPAFATRGCSYSCEYCCSPKHSGSVYRHHSTAYVAGLVSTLYREHGVDFINLMDDNLTEDLGWAKELCRALAALDLPITYRAGRGIRIDRTDPELFRLMKAAGFDSVTLPIESGSDRILSQMGKQITTAPVLETARQVRAAGLKVYAFLMYGYPGETEADIRLSLSLMRAVKPDYFLLFRFNPLPGTKVYQRLRATGEIPDLAFESIPYNFTRGNSTYAPPTLKGFDFRRVLIKEYLRMFLTRPTTMYHYFQRNRPLSTLGVLKGRFIER